MNTTLSKTIRISLILAACLFVFSSCIRKKADYGKVVVKNIPVEKFHELEVSALVPVHIIPRQGMLYKGKRTGRTAFIYELPCCRRKTGYPNEGVGFCIWYTFLFLQNR